MKWVLAERNDSAAEALAGAGLHPLVATLLVNRGITGPAEARAFLDTDLSGLSSSRIFSGMERAAERISQALSRREPIVVYGDYDVDGVSASALLYLVLKDLGALVESYIPDRMTEGYGLNGPALGRIREAGTRLVITVDCGISAVEEAREARALGLDLIITDHHELAGPGPSGSPVLPEALAILHPGLLVPDCPELLRQQVAGLTGVGIAFKLAQELIGAGEERLHAYLDLVTLGTIADVGRVLGENRILVRHGLERLSLQNGSPRPGIEALKQVAGLSGRKITAGSVGFSIAPRINASGRLERADTAFRLLTTGSPDEALILAQELDAVNRERQGVEEGIHEAARRLSKQQDLPSTGALVLASDGWHAGVIGIVASRLVDEFYRPAALISISNGVGKGSARSIPGFDLYHGLMQCADLLLGFGGHKYAAGFSINTENIPLFRERLNALALQAMPQEGFVRTLVVDAPVTLDRLTMPLLQELDRLAPFGQGNPEPRLGIRDAQVVSSRVVGNSHLKLRLRDRGGTARDAIAFNRGQLLGRSIRDGVRVAAVITPKVNTWNGSASVELEIRDLKLEK